MREVDYVDKRELLCAGLCPQGFMGEFSKRSIGVSGGVDTSKFHGIEIAKNTVSVFFFLLRVALSTTLSIHVQLFSPL